MKFVCYWKRKAIIPARIFKKKQLTENSVLWVNDNFICNRILQRLSRDAYSILRAIKAFGGRSKVSSRRKFPEDSSTSPRTRTRVDRACPSASNGASRRGVRLRCSGVTRVFLSVRNLNKPCQNRAVRETVDLDRIAVVRDRFRTKYNGWM